MSNLSYLPCVPVLVCLVAACGKVDAQPEKPVPGIDRRSYSIGADIGQRLRTDGLEVNVDMLIRGLREGLGGEMVLTADEIRSTLQELQQENQARRQAARTELGAKNKAAGDAFLAENRAKEGVVTTASGLQYKVLTAGTGEKPGTETMVKVHYRGTLIDGTPFDSSYDRGEPASFPLNRVIGGWTEALQLMPVGSKWQLFIPPELAYGESGPPQRGPEPPVIGPNATLVFEVELLEIVE